VRVVVSLVSFDGDDARPAFSKAILEEDWTIGRGTRNFHSTPMKSTQLGSNVLNNTDMKHFLLIEVNFQLAVYRCNQ
jgi:hypothetical protein